MTTTRDRRARQRRPTWRSVIGGSLAAFLAALFFLGDRMNGSNAQPVESTTHTARSAPAAAASSQSSSDDETEGQTYSRGSTTQQTYSDPAPMTTRSS